MKSEETRKLLSERAEAMRKKDPVWMGDKPAGLGSKPSGAKKSRPTEQEMAVGARKFFADKAKAKKAAIDKMMKSKKMGK